MSTRMLLFDGESGLRSKKVQNEMLQKYQLKIHAEPFFKRNMAERAIREIKLRMLLLLDMENKPLTRWKEHLPTVLNTINNHNKKTYRSLQNQLLSYFTQQYPSIPQSHSALYKFKVNDIVGFNAFAKERRQIGFKYTFNLGEYIKISIN
jgi:hypothetical protein